MKELEQENARLKRVVASMALDNAILREAAKANSDRRWCITPGGRLSTLPDGEPARWG